MPETVFFKEGKIDFLTSTDKDLCLSLDVKTKLQNLEVRKKLQEIVKERLKDSENMGKELALQARLNQQRAAGDTNKKGGAKLDDKLSKGKISRNLNLF